MRLIGKYEINDLDLSHYTERNIWRSNFDIWKKEKIVIHSLITSINLMERIYNEINRE